MQILTLFIGLLLITLTACAAERSTTRAHAAHHVAGHNWQITTLDGAPVTAGLTLQLTADSISGNSGLNTFGGTATMGESTLVVGPLRMTRRAGPAAQMATESAYLKALAAVQTWTIANEILSLSDADGAIRLTANAQPDEK